MDSPRRVVLDMDNTEIPVYGEQEQSAYSGHFESTWYHPLLLFNGEGDCLAAELRPGNVHSARTGRKCFCQRSSANRKWGNAAFAKPEIDEALEERTSAALAPITVNHILISTCGSRSQTRQNSSISGGVPKETRM